MSNCQNCGAPLTLVDGRDHFRCEFCHTLNFPTAVEDALDGVKPLGTPADENCPTCDATMEHASIDGTRVIFCGDCRGILVQSEAFGHIVQKKRASFRGPDVIPSPIDRVQFERRLHCPDCDRPMETHAYYGPGNAVIDSCAACKLIWLDHGEVAAIESAPGRR